MISRLCTLFLFVSALAFAETWTGKLIDASCAQRDEHAACSPTQSTSTFALRVEDKTYKFDSEGNRKAAEAYRASESGAERAKDPDQPAGKQSGDVTAMVNGTLSNDVISVESIQVQ